MGKIQCPNCNSYNTNEKLGKSGCGCLLMFLGLLPLGLGSGMSSFYGGSFTGGSPLFGIVLIIIGIIIFIYSMISSSRKGFEEWECKNCKYEFQLKKNT